MPRRQERKKKKYLGNRTHGAGNMKNRRGKGSKGGRGRAGLHKHKRFQQIKREGTAGPKGFVSPTRSVFENVSIERLARQAAAGKWPQEGGAYNIVLGRRVKVLGGGKIGFKANVTAGGFSESAKKKIEEAGGTAKTVM
ncbi:MAG: uL15 family ribosomal protein [Candidatus Micrarchaeota archaeon]|nr:uL15 family ribosomal protein [Candidatus Micrarchaeota archaeon]